MKWRLFTLIILLILFSVFGFKFLTQKSIKKTCDRCNILLIDIDSLRADALPCYGYKRNTTPNICTFAQKSVIFKDNYSPSYWTLPSIFSTITSLYPTFHRVRNEYIDVLSPEIPTMAEIFKQNGYHTVLVGIYKSESTLSQNNEGYRGYDEIISDKAFSELSQVIDLISHTSNTSNPWFIHVYISSLHLPYLLSEGKQPIEQLPKPEKFPITQKEFDVILDTYIKNHYQEVFNKSTILQYVLPLLSQKGFEPLQFLQLYNDLCNHDKKITYCLNVWNPRYNSYMQFINTKNPSDIAYLRLMYDTKLSEIDEMSRSLFKLLESQPYKEKTITIIMSDHGEAFGEHDTFNHDATAHTELYHTPPIACVLTFQD